MLPQPGEVWLADLGLAAKTRPVVIVSRADPVPAPHLVLYVPLTTQDRRSRYEVALPRLRFLDRECVANVQGLGSLARVRLDASSASFQNLRCRRSRASSRIRAGYGADARQLDCDRPHDRVQPRNGPLVAIRALSPQDSLHRVDQAVDLVPGIVEGQRWPDGGFQPEAPQRRLAQWCPARTAMPSRSNIRPTSSVLPVAQHEGEHADLFPRGSDQAKAVDPERCSVAYCSSSCSYLAMAGSPRRLT